MNACCSLANASDNLEPDVRKALCGTQGGGPPFTAQPPSPSSIISRIPSPPQSATPQQPPPSPSPPSALRIRVFAQSGSGPSRAVDLSQLTVLQDPEVQRLLAGSSGKNGVLSVPDAAARTRLLEMLRRQVLGIVKELGLPCGSVLHLGDDISYACPGEMRHAAEPVHITSMYGHCQHNTACNIPWHTWAAICLLL